MMNIGTQFERDFALLTKAELTPGSGNQFYATMDLEQVGTILWSLKATQGTHTGHSPIRLMDEVESEANARGISVIPAVAVRLLAGQKDQRDIAMLSVSDLMRINVEQISLARETKAEARRREAAVPELLREDL